MKTYFYNKNKAGLPPGTVLYTGENKNSSVDMELYSFGSNELIKKKISVDELEEIKNNGKINWININGIHDTELLNKFGAVFEIDNLVLEDITNVNQRVKMEEWGDYLFIVLKIMKKNKDEISHEQVSFILGKSYLLTFQEEAGDIFDTVKKRMEKIIQKGIGYTAYALIDIIVDNYLIVLDSIQGKVDNLEYEILNNFSNEQAEKILKLKTEISILKKGIYPIREISAKFQNGEVILYFGKNNKMYLSDLHDHGIIICDAIESILARTSELFQLYYSVQSNELNNVMKVLAIISTIFMPLSFLAGLYGMNFSYMPELEWKYGYFIILGIMFILVVIMIIVFKKKKWL